MSEDKIREKMKVYINGYKKGLTDRDYVEERINYYYDNYGPFDRQEYYSMLDKIDGKQKTRPSHKEISNKIIADINEYKLGNRDREYIEKQINHYKKDYGYSTLDTEIIDMLEEIGIKDIDKKYDYSNDPNTKKTALVITIIIFALIAVGVIRLGIWLFSDLDDGPDYTTYYDDENGNGKLDRGEGNYTTDEDGNVVDWDEDNNNFE